MSDFLCPRPETELARDKLLFLRTTKFSEIQFAAIHPDERHNWLHLDKGDWNELIPVASREAKRGAEQAEPKAIFQLHSLGVATNRDEWVYMILIGGL